MPIGFIPEEVWIPSSSSSSFFVQIDPFFATENHIGYMVDVHGVIMAPSTCSDEGKMGQKSRLGPYPTMGVIVPVAPVLDDFDNSPIVHFLHEKGKLVDHVIPPTPPSISLTEPTHQRSLGLSNPSLLPASPTEPICATQPLKPIFTQPTHPTLPLTNPIELTLPLTNPTKPTLTILLIKSIVTPPIHPSNSSLHSPKAQPTPFAEPTALPDPSLALFS